jgi:hypothetical protein
MKRLFSQKLLLASLCLLAAGCISHERTYTKDPARAKVEFENDVAARTFYEALSRMPGADARSESTTKFEIPVVFEHKSHVITGANATFNHAVEICDTNKDGKITEQEARIFAEFMRNRAAR